MEKPFFARYSFLILIITVFSLPIMWGGTKRALQYPRNNIKEWLPSGAEELNVHRWFQENFPMEQFIIISWDGCTIDDPRIPKLQKALEPRRDNHGRIVAEDWDLRYFLKSMSGVDFAQLLLNNFSEMTKEEAIERLKGTLIGKDGRNTCIMVNLTPDAEGENLLPQINKIYELCRQCGIGSDTRTLDELKKVVHLGGPPVDNVAIDQEGNRTLIRLGWLSCMVGFSIATLIFRSIRLTMIVLFTAMICAGYSLALVRYTGGTMDAILLSMPPLIYVLGMSGAVHIVNYYHDAIREPQGLIGAPDRAIGHALFPTFYAEFTTAIGVWSLLTSQVVPIRNFGWYSGIGVMFTLSVLFLFLPAMLYYFPSRKFAQLHGGKGHSDDRSSKLVIFWRWCGKKIIKNYKLVLLGCFGLMVVSGFGLVHLKTSVKLMKFFTNDTTIVKDYTWLEKHLGPLVPMEIVLRFDNETCPLNTVQRLRLVRQVSQAVFHMDKEKVDGVLSAATMTPDLEPKGFGALKIKADLITSEKLDANRGELRDYITTDIGSAVKRKPDVSITELDLPPNVVEKLKNEKITTVSELWNVAKHFKTVRYLNDEEKKAVQNQLKTWAAPIGDDLWRITARVFALTDLDYGDFIQELKPHLDPVVSNFVNEGLPLGSLRDSPVMQKHPEKLKNAAGEPLPMTQMIPIDGVEIIYTGTVPLVYKTQHNLLECLTQSVLLSFVLIAGLMMLVFRSATGGLITMLPNVFPIIIVFGVMSWLNILCDVGTMMTASVALGIAVDDTVHFLTWFRHGMAAGMNYKESIVQAYERCAAAITQTTLISGLGLSVFAFSTFTPTLRFGVMMLVLLFTATFGDLIFLPALLAWSKGRFFGNKHFMDDFRPIHKVHPKSQIFDRKEAAKTTAIESADSDTDSNKADSDKKTSDDSGSKQDPSLSLPTLAPTEKSPKSGTSEKTEESGTSENVA